MEPALKPWNLNDELAKLEAESRDLRHDDASRRGYAFAAQLVRKAFATRTQGQGEAVAWQIPVKMPDGKLLNIYTEALPYDADADSGIIQRGEAVPLYAIPSAPAQEIEGLVERLRAFSDHLEPAAEFYRDEQIALDEAVQSLTRMAGELLEAKASLKTAMQAVIKHANDTAPYADEMAAESVLRMRAESRASTLAADVERLTGERDKTIQRHKASTHEAVRKIEALGREKSNIETTLSVAEASLAEALKGFEDARQEIVLAITFLGRDNGTGRMDTTVPQLIDRLATADADIRRRLAALWREGEARK